MNREDIERFRLETCASSVMIARAVMWNASLLRPDGILPIDTVVIINQNRYSNAANWRKSGLSRNY